MTDLGEFNGKEVCELTGTFTEDLTLYSTMIYVLKESVSIGENKEDAAASIKTATLTIKPGTRIEGTLGRSFLVINRGSKIMAEGTKENPIVFTSNADEGSRKSGDWGGIQLNGFAPVNCAGAVTPCQRLAETGVEWYGGDKADDNSGVLKFVQIEFTGFKINSEKEFNGLTLQGVGNKTVIENIHVNHGLDDGIEFFGGTVNVKRLVLTDADDDCFDWTFGWSGKAQFVICEQSETAGDKGIEADNNDKKTDDSPRSNPTLSNFTLIGKNGTSGTTGGAMLREGTSGHLNNMIFTGFVANCIDIDQEETFNNAPDATAPTNLQMVNSIVNCTKNFEDGDEDASFTQPFLVEDWFNNQDGNMEADPKLNGWIPKNDSPAPGAGVKPADAFFEAVDFIGAIKNSANDWTAGWISTVSN